MQHLSLVFSFKNEEKNIPLLIDRLEKTFKNINNWSYDYIFVNDCSEDDSENILIDLQKKYPITIINMSRTFGVGPCVIAGFRFAKGDAVIYMDTDLQDDPKYIPEFIDNIKKGFDIVIGVRKNRKAPVILTAGLKIYDLIFEIIFKKKLSTYRAPFVAYKKEYVNNLPWYNNDHRYFIPIAINKGAKLIKEFDVSLNKRNSGKSHYNKYFKVFWGIVELLIFIFRMKTGKYS